MASICRTLDLLCYVFRLGLLGDLAILWFLSSMMLLESGLVRSMTSFLVRLI